MENKQLWGDKTPELSAYLPEIKALFPTARVIHIVRNPFANCKSLKERQYLHIKLAAQQWKDTNAQGLLEQYMYGPQQYHLLRYEDLLRYPENTVRELCTFLNIPFEEGMLRLAKATSTQKSNAYVSASFNTQKLEDWKRALSLSEKRSIQDITGDLMTAFDYAPIPDLPINMVRSLSYGQRIRLRTWNILRLLFKKERVTMSGHTLTPISLTVSKRVRTAVGQWIRLFFSAYIYQVFLETIRKEYKKPEPDK